MFDAMVLWAGAGGSAPPTALAGQPQGGQGIRVNLSVNTLVSH